MKYIVTWRETQVTDYWDEIEAESFEEVVETAKRMTQMGAYALYNHNNEVVENGVEVFSIEAGP